MSKKKPTSDPRGRCGTRAGYDAHRKRGERACDACRYANTLRQRRKRSAKRGESEPGVRSSAPRRVNVPAEWAPTYLRSAGQSLWNAVTEDFELNAAAKVVLTEVCRSADRLERIAGALSSRKSLWFELKESDVEPGQLPEFTVVVNGMIGEARQLQSALRMSLNQLGVMEVGGKEQAPEKSALDQLREKREERQRRAAEEA